MLVRYIVTSIATALALTLFGPVTAAQETPGRLRNAARIALKKVATWGCQYQNVVLDELIGSKLDLVVINHVLDGSTGRIARLEDIKRLQLKADGGRRLVLAYLSVGEAEAYRSYWKSEWRDRPPAWLGPENSNYVGIGTEHGEQLAIPGIDVVRPHRRRTWRTARHSGS